ncbi:MAG: N-acetyl-gamma-glutamyl-phosphate reductase [Fimbriimonadaceae bacterium]|nr:N-acetyl-gamma-glutamyl-phosphate reductase [Chthonomonadaceae bacterium]MCO5295839.1 N-acetyl-gamma-glutamyl-phosphate reductase [Fimbriimonadaceae bacterium]
MIRVAVVGATGYGGAEAVRLLAAHPGAEVVAVTSARLEGTPLRDACPWLDTDLVLSRFEAASLPGDVALLCQESGFAMEHAHQLLERMRVIDFSADFRLRDRADYPRWYGREHSSPEVEAVYGLPELESRDAIARAALVANPGCYPTAALLALVPLERAGLIDGTPVVDAKSGVSGAGRSRTETDYLLGELEGGFKAYGVTGHRHTPEIEQGLGRPVRFTPHLLPFARGIHATCHVPLRQGADREDVLTAWAKTYAEAPFVRIREEGWPSTKEVRGTNACVLAAAFDGRTGHAVVVSVLDNLVKGAAGQAVQNLNVMFGLDEATGLTVHGVWP